MLKQQESEQHEQYDRLPYLAWALNNNAEAVSLCEQLVYVSHLWDDLIDGDVAVDAERVNRAMWTAIVDVPANPFYQRHYGQLAPVIRQSIIDWMDATTLERQDQHGQTIAFVLRDGIQSVITTCAYLVGGYDWMREVTAEIRRQGQFEPLSVYLAEHSEEHKHG